MTLSASRFLAGTAAAPRQHWYVAAFSNEVGEGLLARTFLGDDVVLYRTQDGNVVALEDRCAHRGAALSCGKKVGDSIQCFYHGIRFGVDGKCSHIPSQSTIPAKMRVRSYPIVEKLEFIWIWMGDPEKADPSKIPDLSEFGWGSKDHYQQTFFLMEINANYQLLQENLLDVSHISFLHEGGFDTGAICTAEPTVSIENGRIRIDREVEEVVVGVYAATFELPDGTRFKRLLRSQSWAPCLNVITNIFWEVDRPDAPPRIIHAIFPITPKTNNSLHYFMASSKNYGIEVIPDSIKQAVWDIFLTDKAAIESIQRSYDLLGSNTPEVSVRADVAALRYRDLVANLVKAESAA